MIKERPESLCLRDHSLHSEGIPWSHYGRRRGAYYWHNPDGEERFEQQVSKAIAACLCGDCFDKAAIFRVLVLDGRCRYARLGESFDRGSIRLSPFIKQLSKFYCYWLSERSLSEERRHALVPRIRQIMFLAVGTYQRATVLTECGGQTADLVQIKRL